MGRPRKDGIEDMMRATTLDDKEEELRSLYGNDAWVALQMIFMNCWSRGVPELDLNDKAKVAMIARKSMVSVEKFMIYIEAMVMVGLFEKEPFATSKILTSQGLRRRICSVMRKRQPGIGGSNGRVSGAFPADKLLDDPPDKVEETPDELVVVVDLDLEDLRKELPPDKTPFGENGFVWLKASEEQRFRTELGEDGFRWCVDKLDGWVRGKVPERGRFDRESREALRKGRNARHTFDSWVVTEWHKHSATLADANVRKTRALNGPAAFQSAAERRAAANQRAGDEFVAEANARAQRGSA